MSSSVRTELAIAISMRSSARTSPNHCASSCAGRRLTREYIGEAVIIDNPAEMQSKPATLPETGVHACGFLSTTASTTAAKAQRMD